MYEDTRGVFWAIVFFGLLIIVGFMSYHDEQVDQQHYCEMVDLWHNNEHVPPTQRPGWPPFNGECDG